MYYKLLYIKLLIINIMLLTIPTCQCLNFLKSLVTHEQETTALAQVKQVNLSVQFRNILKCDSAVSKLLWGIPKVPKFKKQPQLPQITFSP